MTDEQLVGRTRIVMRNGTHFVTTEPLSEVAELLEDDVDWLALTSVSGQPYLPAEALLVRSEDITSVHAVSYEGWVWQKHLNEHHYEHNAETPS
jgi:hypothetical protein